MVYSGVDSVWYIVVAWCDKVESGVKSRWVMVFCGDVEGDKANGSDARHKDYESTIH